MHQNDGQVFYSQIKQVFSYKNTFLPIKGCETLQLYLKTPFHHWKRMKMCFFLGIILLFVPFLCFTCKTWKKHIWTSLGVGSTQMLVKISNTLLQWVKTTMLYIKHSTCYPYPQSWEYRPPGQAPNTVSGK